DDRPGDEPDRSTPRHRTASTPDRDRTQPRHPAPTHPRVLTAAPTSGDSGCEPGGGVTLGGSLCRRPLPGGGVERVTVDDQPRISQELGEPLELLRGHAGCE